MAFRPNILLIQADQHRFDCVGANGYPFLQTPHLDRLASEGVNFTHAFCPSPVCTPARNSLLFGCWPTQHGAITNAGTEAPQPPRQGLTPWSALLAEVGYQTGCVGKWGVDPQNGPTHYGFHDYVPEGEYAAWRAAQGLPPRRPTNGYFGETDTAISPDQSRLAWGASRAMELLTRYAQADAPFFLRWDPSEPHLPNVVPEPYASLYPADSIPPWPGFDDLLIGKPYAQAQQRRTWRVDGWTWSDWAPLVGRYLGEITLLDAQVGRLLSHLDTLGIADKTAVVYTADHGDMGGSHGMIDKHLVLYDDVVRVPLLVRAPFTDRAYKRPGREESPSFGREENAPASEGRPLSPAGGFIPPAGTLNDAFISSALDLAATFCDWAGVPVPPAFAGRSLVPLLRGEPDDRPDCAFAMYQGGQFGLYSQRMVRDRRWKYVWNATAEDELYDLAYDPGEIVNRATDPECRDDLRRLRRLLVDWMEAQADPLCNEWTRPQLLQDRTR